MGTASINSSTPFSIASATRGVSIDAFAGTTKVSATVVVPARRQTILDTRFPIKVGVEWKVHVHDPREVGDYECLNV